MPNFTSTIRRFRLLTLLLVLVPTGPAAGQAGDFEEEPTLEASEYLSAEQVKGPHHQINESVANDGYMNTYRIESAFGTFEAYGNAMLVMRLREIGALAELDQVSQSEVFVKATAKAALAQVETIQDFATRPVETVKGIPDGVKGMFRRAKRDVKEGVEVAKEVTGTSKDEEADPAEAEAAAEDPEKQPEESVVGSTEVYAKRYLGVPGAERRWAQKLGVDPYSSNEVLRREIHKVAKVDAVGSFSMKFVPIPTIPGVDYIHDVTQAVWNTDPRELREINEKMLVDAGASEQLIAAFFENPWYTPSSQTYLLATFASLDGVDGRDVLVEQAAMVGSEPQAMFFLQAMRMLAGFHASEAPFVKLLGGGRLPAGLTEGDRLVFLVPVDFLSWTQGIAAAADGPFREVGEDLQTASREVWFRGGVSARANEELTSRGWRVVDHVDFATETGTE